MLHHKPLLPPRGARAGGIPFWRCAFGVIIQLGVLPSVMVALCSARGGGPLLFPWPSRLQVRSPSRVTQTYLLL